MSVLSNELLETIQTLPIGFVKRLPGPASYRFKSSNPFG